MEGTNMRNVTKEIFLKAIVCPTWGWLIRHDEISEVPTLGERFRMEQGMEVGRRARKLYPGGVLVEGKNIASAIKRTKALIDNPGVSIIFEGTFFIDGLAAKADILERKSDGWHLIEVKSSANDKEKFIDDMAYTAMVIGRSGFNISDITLLLISKDFRLGMKDDNLFVRINHTDEVLDRVEEFKPIWEQIEEITRKSIKPEPKLRFDCRICDIFKKCLGRGIDNHIFDIPRLNSSKFDRLTECGIVCIEDIPDGFPLTENQTKVRNCVKTKKPFVGDKLKNELKSISWPAYYLDFETVMLAIPLYPGIAPYTQIPTQYSIHKCSELGQIIDHSEYLADPSKDCRMELAENLIKYLEGESSIIVYSNFEKVIINSLGSVYPDFSKELNCLIDRMINLETIIRKNFYHPDFHGRTSLKKTLPALVSDLSYDGLEIADGDSAMVAFAYLALGKYEGGAVGKIKRKLLDYCKQDTLSMVRLHQRLGEYI